MHQDSEALSWVLEDWFALAAVVLRHRWPYWEQEARARAQEVQDEGVGALHLEVCIRNELKALYLRCFPRESDRP